jgi:cell division protein FtsW (lipid II flippase)
MLYMTTRRSAYLVGTLILLVVGAIVAYKAFGHVRVRVENWTNPWPNASNSGRQPVQGWYALGSGGIAGTGLGLGQPWQVPLASTDYMFSSIGEELGLVGSIGVIALFMLFVGSAYRIAIDTVRPFTKLFAAGIATIIGLQTFLIIGGVTRVIPLTGISLPFVSYGGSSLVANFALLAILLRLSDDAVREASPTPAPGAR